MKYRLVAVFALLFCSISLLGQRGYFVTDTSTNLNMKLILGDEFTNAKICKVKTGKEIVSYTPNDIKEYGYKNGRVYRSKDIVLGDSTAKAFLELLHNGSVSLYYYRGENIKTFFIEKDSSLFVEIPKKDDSGSDYSIQLLQYTKDCHNIADACKLVAYNKSSMARLISRYNACELKPFPFTEYGVFFGFNQSRLLTNTGAQDEFLTTFSFEAERNMFIGIFFDRPIFASDFSLYSSIGVYRSAYSSNALIDNFDADVLINQTTMIIPVLIRYSVPLNALRPYFNLGVNYICNVQNESTIYKAQTVGGVIQYEEPDKQNIIATHQPGYAYGFGLQFNLDYKRMMFLELRVHRDYSLGLNDMLHKNSMEILCGISF